MLIIYTNNFFQNSSSIEQCRELETNWEIAKLIVGYE